MEQIRSRYYNHKGLNEISFNYRILWEDYTIFNTENYIQNMYFICEEYRLVMHILCIF